MRSLALLPCFALVACTGGAPASPGGDGAADATVDGDDGGACLFCVDADDDAPLTVQVRDRLIQVCGQVDGCHGSNSGGMTISPNDPFKNIINVHSTEFPSMLRVAPGDPLNSYVYLKLRCAGGIDGGCMPGGGDAGGDPKVARIFHDWIEAGAPDD
jgi:hypothetical protein